MVVVVAVAGLRTVAAVVQQEAHRVVVLVSRRGLGGSSNGIVGITVWGCGWWLVLAHYIGLFSHKVPY